MSVKEQLVEALKNKKNPKSNPQKWFLPKRRGKKNYEDIGDGLLLQHDIGLSGDKLYRIGYWKFDPKTPGFVHLTGTTRDRKEALRMADQFRGKEFRINPGRNGKHNPPGRRIKIYERVGEIRAQKGPGHRCSRACKAAGHWYVHRFKNKASIYGEKSGKLTIE